MTDDHTLRSLRQTYQDIRAPEQLQRLAVAEFRRTRQRPVWQPALAVAVLALTVIVVPGLLQNDAQPTNDLTLPARDFPMPSLTGIELPQPRNLNIPRPSVRIEVPTLISPNPNGTRNEA